MPKEVTSELAKPKLSISTTNRGHPKKKTGRKRENRSRNAFRFTKSTTATWKRGRQHCQGVPNEYQSNSQDGSIAYLSAWKNNLSTAVLGVQLAYRGKKGDE